MININIILYLKKRLNYVYVYNIKPICTFKQIKTKTKQKKIKAGNRCKQLRIMIQKKFDKRKDENFS